MSVAGVGCSTNRAVLSGPEPQTLSQYLATSHPQDILVTDKHGGSHWMHNPVVDGDTLRGVRSRDLPQPKLAIAIADVSEVEEPHFSGGKTLGLVGAIVGVTGVLLLILASTIGTHVTY